MSLHLSAFLLHDNAALVCERAFGFPMFHELTGCDTVSFFAGRGKKTAWDIWGVLPELTATLPTLSSLPEVVDSACLTVVERLAILLYNRTSTCNLTKVNVARQELFCKKCRTLGKFLQPKRHSCSTPIIQCIKVGTFGPQLLRRN